MATRKKSSRKKASKKSMVGKCKTVTVCGKRMTYCFGKKGIKKGYPKRAGKR